jgi:hypothetical protein
MLNDCIGKNKEMINMRLFKLKTICLYFCIFPNFIFSSPYKLLSNKLSVLIAGGLFDATHRRNVHPNEGRLELRLNQPILWRLKPLIG